MSEVGKKKRTDSNIQKQVKKRVEVIHLSKILNYTSSPDLFFRYLNVIYPRFT